jgi:hypothetical protein
MSERRVRKTETTQSFDRPPLNALRVFEAVAVLLVRFARPVAGRVAVEAVQTVTLDWLETQIRRTYAAGLTVWDRINKQKKPGA